MALFAYEFPVQTISKWRVLHGGAIAFGGLLMLCASCPNTLAEQSKLEVERSLGQVIFRSEGVAGAELRTPREGLWSIGTGWSQNEPVQWTHAKPTKVTHVDDWIVLTGEVETSDGTWTVTDQYHHDVDRGVNSNLIQAKRRWRFDGKRPTGEVVLSIRFEIDRAHMTAMKPFLPGIQYYGNPSGSRIDASRVPTWSGVDGERGLYEEHRFPLPFAAAIQSGRHVAALHSRPSILPFAARKDLWWSLGIVETEAGNELQLLSGPVASNGQVGVVKARQKSFLPYENAHLIGITPGAVIEKEFWIQLAPETEVGHEFKHPLWTSIELFDPVADHAMPKITQVVAAKVRDTFSRWHEDESCQGFRTRPPHAQPWFMMGWADRAEVPGHALLSLDLSQVCEDPSLWRNRAAASLDFLSTSKLLSPKAGQPKPGFSIVYDYKKHEWLPRANPLSQAQALLGIARAIRACEDSDGLITHATIWKEFVHKQLMTIADRINDPNWRPVSTNEAFAIAPLVIGEKVLKDPNLLEAAERIGDHTIARHCDMTEPYWGGTLDAKCEDKEGAWAALQGFAALYESTQDPKYLKAAVHAADVCLSYLYVWDVDLPPGRLANLALKTRGWTSVSVQNQHLDVFGVVFTPVLWQLGQWTGNARYQKLAQVMMVSCGQMTDLVSGIHGEQLFQTNYEQHDARDVVEGMRGGYSEKWNIYWITAHFLTAAAEFERLGVDWRRFPLKRLARAESKVGAR